MGKQCDSDVEGLDGFYVNWRSCRQLLYITEQQRQTGMCSRSHLVWKISRTGKVFDVKIVRARRIQIPA